MICDLYARLERRSWLDLVRLPVVLMLAFACFILGATISHAASMRFTETTGRAVIIDPEMEREARRMALEDALYLAALEGGARIDGFSAVMTDSSHNSWNMSPIRSIFNGFPISYSQTVI